MDFWNTFYYWAFLLLSPANCGAMTGNEGRHRRRIMCNKGWPWYQEKIRLLARATTIWRNASVRKDFSGTPSASVLRCLKHYNVTWDSTALQKWILYFPTGQITATCVMKAYKIKVPNVFLFVFFKLLWLSVERLSYGSPLGVTKDIVFFTTVCNTLKSWSSNQEKLVLKAACSEGVD